MQSACEGLGREVSAETVRRCLHAQGLVWRRPRPVLGPTDPQRPWKLRKIRELLRDLPEDETAVFQDEVDLNLNPDMGCCWMEKAPQPAMIRRCFRYYGCRTGPSAVSSAPGRLGQ